jgi:hypothetical protein
LMTNSWIDLAIAKKMATKKSFNESDFIAEFEREKRTN